MIKPIVVGADGSRESAAAADWAAREALRRGLPLRLVHAWEGLPSQGTEATLPELAAPQYWARRVLRTMSEQLHARYPKLYVSTEQLRLPPGQALLAEAESAELLVLGNQGLGSVSGLFMGSVATATAAHTARPLVLVRAGYTGDSERLPDPSGESPAHGPYRDVALAVDLRESCDEVLEFAFRAAEFRGAPLRVVHAWHVSLRRGVVGPDERAAVKKRAEHELAVLLAPWRDKFPKVPARERVVEGHPTHHVVKAAGGAGLLVVGRRARRAAIGAHAGPVTHAVIHHVDCPVAVVPHD
ncbi:universal stress protein [Streptomyces sp. SID8379]|uniref:universal stress protein n=1 Tax=unclassified Streptomyces TaxID=2593676 RepID=UPI00039E6460|nr:MULTISPECIES: universal stress protein [unclassified Streptomyces]MYW69831.1 universal stress protein [Streptomyces sp. SID8379]